MSAAKNFIVFEDNFICAVVQAHMVARGAGDAVPGDHAGIGDVPIRAGNVGRGPTRTRAEERSEFGPSNQGSPSPRACTSTL